MLFAAVGVQLVEGVQIILHKIAETFHRFEVPVLISQIFPHHRGENILDSEKRFRVLTETSVVGRLVNDDGRVRGKAGDQ